MDHDLHFKAFDKVLPEKASLIRAGMAHNASVEVRNRLKTYKGIDRIHGLKNKRKYAKKHNKRVAKATFNVNYTGYYDWGDLQEYVKSLVYIVDGHFVCEVSAVGDKIFIADMALVKSKKYITALESVFRELDIPYTLEGPFPKNLPWQDIPRTNKETLRFTKP